ncbi:MAG: diaminopropionate ammonia-lyase [Phycisphaerales bacterium]|nr:MAG: diaminopropionate ammonia-lyase [Phycisphaerales bacterium]
MGRLLFNDAVSDKIVGLGPGRGPLEFHRRLPGYRPTPLRRLPELASRLRVGEVFLKDESDRLRLPAFKILGASWAAYRAAVQRLGQEPPPWSTIEELRPHLEPLKPLDLITATDGNHGRAVARIAALLGFDAHVFVPFGTVEARVTGIKSEGATVITVSGTYDDAVASAAGAQGDRSLLIQDTSWPGYEEVPAWVIEGYSTMFREIDNALAEAGKPGPDLVVVQIGVGALAAATVSHYRRADIGPTPRILAVEPVSAACALAAFESRRVVTIRGPHDSIMAGLNCGTLATVAWPLLKAGIDCFVTIGDERAREAMRELAVAGVVSGESGAAGLGALLELLEARKAHTIRARLGIDNTSRVLLISTEGATDPASYEQVVGRPPAAVGGTPG